MFPAGTVYIDPNVAWAAVLETLFARRFIEFDLTYSNVNNINPSCQQFVAILMEEYPF